MSEDSRSRLYVEILRTDIAGASDVGRGVHRRGLVGSIKAGDVGGSRSGQDIRFDDSTTVWQEFGELLPRQCVCRVLWTQVDRWAPAQPAPDDAHPCSGVLGYMFRHQARDVPRHELPFFEDLSKESPTEAVTTVLDTSIK